MIKQLYPGTEVTGLDGDARILETAHAKALKAGLQVTFDHGVSYKPPLS